MPAPMYNPLYGPRYKPGYGAASAFGGGVAFGPTDATSGKSVPLSQADWNQVDTGAGISTKTLAHTHGCQDASGNPAATVGATALTATGLVYQQAVSGWTRQALGFDAGTTDAATFAAGTGPNPSTTSCLWFGYIDLTATVGTLRQFLAVGGAAGASECTARQTTSQTAQIKVMGTSTSGSVAMEPGGVLPVFLLYDRTNSAAKIYTPAEMVTGTYNSGVTDGTKGWGAGVVTVASPFLLLLSATWSGADAELTDSQFRSRMQAMGWTVAW